MELLYTLTQQELDPASPKVDTAKFPERKAARAVIFDSVGQVYLMSVKTRNYHKLPGGGIDDDESIEEALKRELMEEVGLKAEIIAEIGSLVEYRDYYPVKQTSYCYLARQLGEQTDSNLEEDELADGMEEVKAKNIDEAIEILSQDKPIDLEGEFIQFRDLLFLKAAKKYLDKQ